MSDDAEDARRLALLLSEAKSRGLPLPSELTTKKKHKWPMDSSGYFVNSEGRKYTPSPQQEGFVHSNASFVGFYGSRGSGKAISIDTPIPTIDGWKSMEDVVVGDVLFSESGLTTNVIDVSPIQYNRDCYKVLFSDESEIIADGEHLWEVMTAKDRSLVSKYGESYKGGRILSTFELSQNLFISERGDRNYSVDCANPIICSHKELPIPPYTFGVWLGDGNEETGIITIGETKSEILDFIREEGLCVDPRQGLNYRIDFVKDLHIRNSKGQYSENPNSFYYKLKQLGVWEDKHIPQIYLRSSVEQRTKLLQGLLDTDGYIGSDSKCEYCTTDEKLADTFYELMVSLGYKVVKKISYVVLNGKRFIRFRFSFVAHGKEFRLSRKQNKVLPPKNQVSRLNRRYIISITPVPSVPVKCIVVDSPSHLYLAGKSMIPTHNSSAGAQKALAKIMQGESGAIMNPDFENMKISTWPEFSSWIPWQMVVPAHRYRKNLEFDPHQPFTLAFMNGAKVLIKGVKEPDSARGPNINWLWGDEFQRDRTGLAWKLASACVRVGNNPQRWATFTPNGFDHWTTKFFINGEIDEEAKRLLESLPGGRKAIECFQGSIFDNQNNLDPGYFASMLAAYPSGWLRDQEIFGKVVNRQGALGDRTWFDGKIIPAPPEMVYARVRFWDLAATEKKMSGNKSNDPDETVGTLMSWDRTSFFVEDQVSGHYRWHDIKDLIVRTAEKDGIGVKIYVEQEPGSGGKNQVEELIKYVKDKLPSHQPIVGWRPPTDRVICANTWFAEAKSGLIYLVSGMWIDGFLNQLSSFPDSATHDDKITSVSGARYNVAPIRNWSKVSFLHL